jgi:predicted TPR repeat methyltransferase
MSEDKFSANDAIDAALKLDGDPRNLKQYYEDWAQSYNLDVSGAEYDGPSVATRLLDRYLPDKRAELLDAGCGTGLVGVELSALGYCHIDGFDLSASMVAQAVATGSYRQVLGDIDMMRVAESYASACYDAVLSVGVFTLGHVPPEALVELLELVKPGGLLLLSTRTQYYQQSGFQALVDGLVESRRLLVLQVIRDAAYNNDGAAHYWVFQKPVEPGR